MVGFSLPIPTICDRHCNCYQADRVAARWGLVLEHPNRRVGQVTYYGDPICSVPGCTRLVYEWGRGHEGHEAPAS